jgi:hypothetical protein
VLGPHLIYVYVLGIYRTRCMRNSTTMLPGSDPLPGRAAFQQPQL